MSQLSEKLENRLLNDEVKTLGYHYIVLNGVSSVKNSVLIKDLTMNTYYRLFHYDTEILTFRQNKENKITIEKILPVSNSSSKAIQQVLTVFGVKESPKQIYERMYNKKLKDLRSTFKNGGKI